MGCPDDRSRNRLAGSRTARQRAPGAREGAQAVVGQVTRRFAGLGQSRMPPELKRRVLVVEDDPDVREAFCELLRVWGHDVLEAADGEMALLIAAKNAPQVILLDLGLPDMDGCEVARHLRAAPGGAERLIIGSTGFTDQNAVEEMAAAGFDAQFPKASEPELLERMLTALPRPRRAVAR